MIGYEQTKNDTKLSELEVQLRSDIKEIKKKIISEHNKKISRTFSIKQSITGILWRTYEKNSGFSIAQIRKHYGSELKQFSDNYESARKAWDEGDMDTVDKFFNFYV